MILFNLLIFFVDDIFSIQKKKDNQNTRWYEDKIQRHKFC